VLDLGAGYGSFINHIAARRRIALDSWPGLYDNAAPGVEVEIRDVEDLGFLAENSLDVIFASNLFEHLTQDKLARVLAGVARALKREGLLLVMQPNFRLAYRRYFDDYTHVAIYTDVSLADFLEVHGYSVLEVQPRFLPLTVESRLPVSEWLIRAYLASPIRPLAGQMFIQAKVRRDD
jgi:SAM-dependent methyltransferase